MGIRWCFHASGDTIDRLVGLSGGRVGYLSLAAS